MRTRGHEIEGTISHLRLEKGTGHVAGDDGQEYWFHIANIIPEGYRALEVGDRVRLRWRDRFHETGRRAVDAVWPLG
jgi:cold shock CspA family protein